MSQTKKQSLYEAVINILIGYITALVSQLIVFPIFDIKVPISDNLLIGLWFTIISLMRSYLVRRYFNGKT